MKQPNINNNQRVDISSCSGILQQSHPDSGFFVTDIHDGIFKDKRPKYPYSSSEEEIVILQIMLVNPATNLVLVEYVDKSKTEKACEDTEGRMTNEIVDLFDKLDRILNRKSHLKITPAQYREYYYELSNLVSVYNLYLQKKLNPDCCKEEDDYSANELRQSAFNRVNRLLERTSHEVL